MFFHVISYINENSILLFYYIYFIYNNVGINAIYPNKEIVLFLGANFFFCKIAYCRENQPVIGTVLINMCYKLELTKTIASAIYSR